MVSIGNDWETVFQITVPAGMSFLAWITSGFYESGFDGARILLGERLIAVSGKDSPASGCGYTAVSETLKFQTKHYAAGRNNTWYSYRIGF